MFILIFTLGKQILDEGGKRVFENIYLYLKPKFDL